MSPTEGDKVIMARFGAPRGMRGELRLLLFSRQPEFFTSLPQWWCRPPQGDWREIEVRSCHRRQDKWFTTLVGVTDRDEAAAWRHGEAAVLRSALPPPGENEYYWCDLIGLSVINVDGEQLGEVSGLQESGSHDILIIAADTADAGEILIPFVEVYVKTVSFTDGVIRVDWQREWT